MVAESQNYVASGMYGLGSDESGRNFSDACLLDMMENFRDYRWGHIGPDLMTRVVKKLCGVENVITFLILLSRVGPFIRTHFFSKNYCSTWYRRKACLKILFIFEKFWNSCSFHGFFRTSFSLVPWVTFKKPLQWPRSKRSWNRAYLNKSASRFYL